MEKKIINSKQTGDSCIYVKHPSGLDIYICEMQDFSTVEALFGTKYGSINTMFKTKEDKEFTTVPEGIAHFLEHKLFENEDCDVLSFMPKQVQVQTHLRPLTRPATFSAVPKITGNLLKYC